MRSLWYILSNDRKLNALYVQDSVLGQKDILATICALKELLVW